MAHGVHFRRREENREEMRPMLGHRAHELSFAVCTQTIGVDVQADLLGAFVDCHRGHAGAGLAGSARELPDVGISAGGRRTELANKNNAGLGRRRTRVMKHDRRDVIAGTRECARPPLGPNVQHQPVARLRMKGGRPPLRPSSRSAPAPAAHRRYRGIRRRVG
jgi:hypothetical protein